MPDTNGVFSRYEYRSKGLAIAGRQFRYLWLQASDHLTKSTYRNARYVTFTLALMWFTITLNLDWTELGFALFVSGAHLLASAFWSLATFRHAAEIKRELDSIHNAAILAMWETTNYDRFNRFPKVST